MNVEGPILPRSHSIDPAPKAGPHLCSCGIPERSGRTVLALANNHVMDYGDRGLKSTLAAAAERNMPVAGAGLTRELARQPHVLTIDGARIGFISCCEAQFGVARECRPGVAEFGPWVAATVRRLRREVDATIVSVHAGMEESPWPIPPLQELYRSWIEAGASVVHGHHAHQPQAYERYEGGYIFYGMGNLAVDPAPWRKRPNTLWSIAASVDLSGSVAAELQFMEIMETEAEDTIEVRVASGVAREAMQRYLDGAQRALTDSDLLEGCFQEASVRAYDRYYSGYLGLPRSGRVDRFHTLAGRAAEWIGSLREGVSRARTPIHHRLMLQQVLFSCETHRAAISTALGVLAGEIEDKRSLESRDLADQLIGESVSVNQW
jgi:hypothetical protein